MTVEFVTKEDLEEFRLRLLGDIAEIVRTSQPKKWLKTHDVMDMLGMSDITLQSLRNRGIIPFRKLGHTCYYCASELDEAILNLPKGK